MIGIWELMLILAIVLILFGAGKITTIMGDAGKGIRAFKEGLRSEAKPADEPAKITAPTEEKSQ